MLIVNQKGNLAIHFANDIYYADFPHKDEASIYTQDINLGTYTRKRAREVFDDLLECYSLIRTDKNIIFYMPKK